MICNFSFAQNFKKDSAYFYFNKAKQFDVENKHFKAYENYIKALKSYQKLKIEDSVVICNLELFDLIESQNNLKYNSKPFLDKYYSLAQKKADTSMLITSNNRYAEYYWNIDTIEITSRYYKKSLKLIKNEKFLKYKPVIYANLAYLYTKNKPDSASIFFKKTLELLPDKLIDQRFGIYINYANFFQQRKLYDSAIQQLKKAEKIEPLKYKLKYKKILYEKFARCYKELNDYENAYKNYTLYNSYRDSLNNTQQNIAIADLDKKYEIAEKEKQILIEQQKKKQNRNLFLGSLSFLVLGGGIGLLTLTNSRKKRLLAEQQQELEKQKNLTLLKEQEIVSINAMIDGQEKERIRIAEDLHDNIGSVLATLKLHFENLKFNREKKQFNQDELYQKTEKLIDETYLKVRSLAHAKNAGVIANKGLLVAVKLMAKKISDANKITIHVLDFGLVKRLDNNLEISIFRIIQELITNIIKHAEATDATINIALYDQNLNIIIEDNGKGFIYDKTTLKEGIGLSSIGTRVQHLNGTFTIDSTISKGTSIIINIPIT
ncbi:hypothetical protein H3Z83_02380 [Tenacibaculum sp. S7007]|uniref:histidine kinase n=1 Tax=Tenacibaculum pelagium TaxID=2759527 RepID=A0A839ALT1_9FLAO|nr:sensor histidine kinase [Tenacibaculum pelagium]MBA6155376.1 hypothetical protein [Tenacibaculum pelagium]